MSDSGRRWLRAAERGWPCAALALLTLAAALPLLHAGVPCTDDGVFHLYKAVELGSLVEAGHLFPRWAPHMAQGYGYPFFNYYAPLSSYGVVWLHFAGLAYPAALTTAFVGALGLAAAAAFWLGRALWGQTAGLAAAAVYVFSPYLAYDILFRGNLAEAFAFVWPPLVLLGLHGALATGASAGEAITARPDTQVLHSKRGFGAYGFLLAALSYAALILTHNAFTLLASPLLAAFVLLYGWQARSGRVAARGALALGLGIGLSAYFWLPALAEGGLVHSDRLLVPPIFTWYTNFITPGELLALPRADDPLLVNPSPARAIGLIPALLCVPALWRAWRRWRQDAQRAGVTVLFAGAVLGYGLMTLPLSTPVWETLRPLELTQFPWRMLGPAALGVAMLVGAGVRALEAPLAASTGGRGRWLARLPALAVIAIVYFANLSWWYPRYCVSPNPATVGNMLAYERATDTIGTTAKGEFLPRTAPGVPPATDLAEALMAGVEPVRLALPVGAGDMVPIEADDPLDATFQVTTDRDLVAVYRQFFFPGWRVSVDGEPAAAWAAGQGSADTADWPGDDNAGLVAFAVPAGEHTLRVWFGLTPLRGAAAALSLAAVATAAACAVMTWRNRRPVPARRDAPGTAQTESPAWVVLLLCAALPIARLLVDRVDNPLRRPAFNAQQLPLTGPMGNYPWAVDFAGGIRLHGYDLSATTVPSGGALDVALYVSRWMADERRYWPALRLEDAHGVTWHAAEQLPPRWHREPPPSALWPLDQYAQWARQVTVLPGTPPGEYALTMEVFDLETLSIASSLDEHGSPAAPRLTLGTITVTRPGRPANLAPDSGAGTSFGPIALLGAEVGAGAAEAGETVRVTLYWRSNRSTGQDWPARLTLSAAEQPEPAAMLEVLPANGYGTSAWRAGDEWRGQHDLRLPATLESGVYTLWVSVPGQAGQAEAGRVRVSAPNRSFVAPEMEVLSGAAWEGIGELAGYTLTRADGALSLSLVWRATATPNESYAVFVHLEGPDGRVWRQSDGVPADWTRPTTGWVAGEYVVDTRRLALGEDLPRGEYRLLVGLYVPPLGPRAAAAGPGAEADGRVLVARLTLP